MMSHDEICMWKDEIRREFSENIMKFWLQYGPDPVYGGLIGRMKNNLSVEKNAPKGLILNVRTLWTFSAAYQFDPKPEYLEMAQLIYDYVMKYFQDRTYGGYYWTVDPGGQPLDTKKRVYGQAFTIYALIEYAKAAADDAAFNEGKALYMLIEQNCRDQHNDGYMETYEQDWSLADDLRLSEKDMDTPKSMNNHLHILEAYTNLFQMWKEPRLADRLKKNIRIFLDHIIDPDSVRFQLFFNEDWDCQSQEVSFGHDIEGSWLLVEAAEVLGNDDLLKEIEDTAIKMADAVLEHGVDTDGGLFYEGNTRGELVDKDKHWWPQAEAVVGFINAFQISGGDAFLKTARASWDFIVDKIKDHEHGEWFWKVTQEGVPVNTEYKICEWKSPYHSGRACMEAIKRLEKLG
ncbi:AGE family epimerase/isomerase [bacterium]|nr:AGE family epimerase/isomerase [bacterium]